MLTKLDSVMLSILSLVIVVSQVNDSAGLNKNTSGPLVEKPACQNTQKALNVAKQASPQSSQLAPCPALPASKLPDFSGISDVRVKKQAFFDYMLPIIEARNDSLKELRKRIKELAEASQRSPDDISWLRDIANVYELKTEEYISKEFFDQLLQRVDIIPPSLALVQAANESAWGTSRFAREGNNLFGQWCFSKGCGLVPSARPAGETYEVRKFDGVAQSVQSYMHNLNTQHQYAGLREIRANKRKNHEPVTGPALAYGLSAYSIRGLEYVEELLAMIQVNNLLNLDHQATTISQK